MSILIRILAVVACVVLIIIIGLKIKPKPFPSYAGSASPPDTVPLPDNLPIPVERFYRTLYGERVPVIRSAILSGPARLRLGGIPFKGRYRFVHEAGQGYRHYIEATFFGLPLMKVNEFYLDGVGRIELPFGVTEDEPKINDAANLGLWAETVWFPALYITDPRVEWLPLDDATAALVVPFGEAKQTLIVRFDPATSLITHLEAMRFKGEDSPSRTRWIDEGVAWRELDGQLTMTTGAVTWMDEGSPWAVFEIEEMVLNADVSDYVKKHSL